MKLFILHNGCGRLSSLSLVIEFDLVVHLRVQKLKVLQLKTRSNIRNVNAEHDLSLRVRLLHLLLVLLVRLHPLNVDHKRAELEEVVVVKLGLFECNAAVW